jgi:hypothetical protein
LPFLLVCALRFQYGDAPLRLLLTMSDSTVYDVNMDDDSLVADFVRLVVRS